MTHTSSMMKPERRGAALHRQVERNRRSPEEQIQLLSGRPGSSSKEVARLRRLIERGTPSRDARQEERKKKGTKHPKGKKGKAKKA